MEEKMQWNQNEDRIRPTAKWPVAVAGGLKTGDLSLNFNSIPSKSLQLS